MVWTGPRVRGASIVAAPIMLTGKRFKAAPLKLPMGGSPFMMQIRGFQAAGRAFHYTMIPKHTMKKVHLAIKKVAMKIYAEAVGPSGDLKASGRFIDDSAIMPGTGGKDQFINMRIQYGGGNVDYAVYVHEGHSAPDGSWVMGKPWLVRAARRYKKSLLRATKHTAMGVWNRFVKQINTGSTWVALGGGAGMIGTPAAFSGAKYSTGAGQGWQRMLSGTGPTVM